MEQDAGSESTRADSSRNAALNEQLALQVRIDALTGAYNRYTLNIEIQQRFKQAIEGNHRWCSI